MYSEIGMAYRFAVQIVGSDGSTLGPAQGSSTVSESYRGYIIHMLFVYTEVST